MFDSRIKLNCVEYYLVEDGMGSCVSYRVMYSGRDTIDVFSRSYNQFILLYSDPYIKKPTSMEAMRAWVHEMNSDSDKILSGTDIAFFWFLIYGDKQKARKVAYYKQVNIAEEYQNLIKQ